MEPTEDDLGEIEDPADRPERHWREGSAAVAVPPNRINALVTFARGDPKLSYWEEKFIADLMRDQRRLSPKQQVIVDQIAAKVGFRP